MNNIPIIFIHYGDATYLKHTLKAARKCNPEKEIVLMGDTHNAKYTKGNISHYLIEDYADSHQIQQFNNSYYLICGNEFEQILVNANFWVRFNFLKWFVILNFCKQKGINQFWHFDTDVLFTEDISKYEKLFSEYDYTTHNNNNVIQGVVNNLKVLEDFTQHIVQLFKDESFLKLQKEEFKHNPRYAFSMMRAFKSFKKNNSYKTHRLNTIIDGKTFDECLFFEDGFEMEKAGDRFIKKVYHQQRDLYLKLKDEYIKLIATNLSWVKPYAIAQLSDIINNGIYTRGTKKINYNKGSAKYNIQVFFISKVKRALSLIKSIKLRVKKYFKISALSRQRKIIIGAGQTTQDGFFPTNISELNITKTSHFSKYWRPNTLQNILAEHVLEYLTPYETEIAISNCYSFLKTGGCLRLAVPDGNFPNEEYIKNNKPGTNSIAINKLNVLGHQVLYNYKQFIELLEKAGFKTELVEYWDEIGEFHSSLMQAERGIISRSAKNDPRNKPGQLAYTSLIVDAIKP